MNDQDASRPRDLAPGILTEYLTDDWGLHVRSAGTLEAFRSKYQDVEVHDSVPFGKLFRLDGHFMTSEKDEFFYHENLVHVAALAHPGPERVFKALEAALKPARKRFQAIRRGTMELVEDEPRRVAVG